MRIVFAHHYSISYVGGGERFLLELARLLSERGYECEVRALPIRRGQILPTFNGVNYVESWLHRFDADVAYFIYAPLIHRLFRTDAPKIAGIHGAPFLPELSSPEAFPRNPVELFRLHDPYFTLAFYWRKMFRWHDLRAFDAVHMINHGKVVHEKVFHIPLFVDTSFYSPKGGKDDSFTALFIGRPLWKKGFDVFVKAAEITH